MKYIKRFLNAIYQGMQESANARAKRILSERRAYWLQ